MSGQGPRASSFRSHVTRATETQSTGDGPDKGQDVQDVQDGDLETPLDGSAPTVENDIAGPTPGQENENGTEAVGKSNQGIQQKGRRHGHNSPPPPIRDDDYTKKYPYDEYGTEMGPDSRLWKVYLKETAIADDDYTSDNIGTLDGILIFASLFSAIVSTFVTQTFSSLQPDPQALLLAELVAVQRMAANGSSVNDVPSSTSDTSFSPSPSDVWMNGLWFTSLMLSLITAFLGVLAKQWLYQYIAPTSGSPRTRALIRQARNLGLQEWYVPTLIGVLPLILHISLALFFTGLVILLHTMITRLAYFVASVVVMVYMAYFISNILPLFYPRCPYRTGLTPKLFRLFHSLPPFPLTLLAPPVTFSAGFTPSRFWDRITWLRRIRLSFTTVKKVATWKEAESAASVSTNGLLEGKAIFWLYTSSYNPSAKQIALEGLAGFPPMLDRYKDSWDVDMYQVVSELRKAAARAVTDGYNESDAARQVDLYTRAAMQMEFMKDRPLPTNHYRFYDMAEGAEELAVSNPNLNALMKCGWFHITFYSAEEFFLATIPGDPGAENPHLPAATWVALLKAAQESIRERSTGFGSDDRLGLTTGFGPDDRLRLTTWMVTILRDTGFFNETLGIPHDIPATTINRPNWAMCLAMIDLVRPRGDINSPIIPSVQDYESAMCAMVELLGWLSEQDSAKVKGISAMLDILLDCLLQSTYDAKDYEYSSKAHPVWSSTNKSAARDTVLSFLQTDWCKTTASSLESQHTIQLTRKAFQILVQLFLPYQYRKETDVQFESNANVMLARYLDSEYRVLPSISQNAAMISLVTLEMQRQDLSTSEGMAAMDFIPTLHSLSRDPYKYGMRSHVHSSWIAAFGPAAVTTAYLESVSFSEDQDAVQVSLLHGMSYVSQQIQYIHDKPDSLFYLCCILLRELARLEEHTPILHSSSSSLAIDGILSSILKLLRLRPKHPSWVSCLNRLREWDPYVENEELYTETTLSDWWLYQNVTYCGIEDIQHILEIEDDVLDHSDWKEKYTDDPKPRYRLKDLYERELSKREFSGDTMGKGIMRRLLSFNKNVVQKGSSIQEP